MPQDTGIFTGYPNGGGEIFEGCCQSNDKMLSVSPTANRATDLDQAPQAPRSGLADRHHRSTLRQFRAEAHRTWIGSRGFLYGFPARKD
jgi:hypothetical protein